MSRSVLREIGADVVPSRLVLNKMDRVDAPGRAALMEKHPDAILLSAHAPEDVSALRDTIIAFEAAMVEDVLLLPYAKQGLIGDVYESARVLSEEHDEAGRVLRGARSAWRNHTAAAEPCPTMMYRLGPAPQTFGETNMAVTGRLLSVAYRALEGESRLQIGRALDQERFGRGPNDLRAG